MTNEIDLIEEVTEEVSEVSELPDLTPKPAEEYVDFAYYICNRILKKYRIPMSAWEDCYMEAMLGLMKAYNTYNKDNKERAKFTTFASFRIMGQVLDYLKKLNYIKYNSDNDVENQWGYTDDIQTSSLSMFDEAGTDEDSRVSLYKSTDHVNGSYDTSLEEVETQLFLNSLIEKAPLTDKERSLIYRRYFKEEPLAAIAKDWECTQVNVSIIGKKAIAKLNKYCKELDSNVGKIKAFLDRK